MRWVNSTSYRFTPYVGVRIRGVLELTGAEQWLHVPTDQNPADDAIRGLSPLKSHPNHCWFIGPEFLSAVPNNWPSTPLLATDVVNDPEIRPTPRVYVVAINSQEIELLIAKISQFDRLVRIVARIQRLAGNMRVPRADRVSGPITAEEYSKGARVLIQHAQSVKYANELKYLKAGEPIPVNSSIVKLIPFVDNVGILRVGGRLNHATIAPKTRHPILLPHDHRLTRVILEKIHQNCGHQSADRTLAAVRNLYWVTKARRTLSTIVHGCLKCRRRKAVLNPPRMADLPPQRLAAGSYPFVYTGVDYMGPFEVTILRRKLKRWICLFTCMTTRAVHLELSYSLSTDSFLSVLFRFEARRGVPREYRSDNGTNFVGAKNELLQCLSALDQDKICANLVRRGVQWKFNPPAPPFRRSMGTARGLWQTRAFLDF